MFKKSGPTRGKNGQFKSTSFAQRHTFGRRFNRTQMLIWALLFAIGGYIVFRSFASTLPPGTVNGKDYLGINTDGNIVFQDNTTINSRLDKIAYAGSKWVRIDFKWSSIMSGGPTSYNWTPYDNFVSLANQHNLKILGTIDYTPAWARPSSCTSMYCPPANNQDYANFAAVAAHRYAPMGVHAWEIWNEPNQGDQFWLPRANAVAYTDMLKRSYPAIKNQDPGATVVLGGLAPCGAYGAWCNNRENPVSFLQEVYNDGGTGYFDAIGWHPYTSSTHPIDYAADWSAWYEMYGSVKSTYPNVRNLMSAHGDTNKKIWMTEFGFYTDATNDGSNRNTTPAQQATLLSQAYTLIKGYNWAGPLFWFKDVDGSQYNDTYGLYDINDAAKPSLSAYMQTAASFTDPDTTPPTISWAQPTAGTSSINMSGSYTFSVQANDNAGGSGIDHVDYYLNNNYLGRASLGLGYVYTWDTIAGQVANGQYTIKARACDKANPANCTDSAPVTVNVNNQVAPPPSAGSATILVPSDLTKTYSGTDVVIATYISSPNGVASVEYYANGSFIGNAAQYLGWDLHWNSTTFPDGPVKLVARGFDKLGNVFESAPITLNVANNGAKPAVWWAAPSQNQATMKAPTTLSVVAQSQYGISKVEYYDAGRNNALIGTTGKFTLGYALGIPQYGPGTYSFYAKAYDNNGQTNTTPVISVKIQ